MRRDVSLAQREPDLCVAHLPLLWLGGPAILCAGRDRAA
jgi:hypothetical protein